MFTTSVKRLCSSIFQSNSYIHPHFHVYLHVLSPQHKQYMPCMVFCAHVCVCVCVCTQKTQNIGDITKRNAVFDRTAQTFYSTPSSDSTTQT